MLDFTELFNFTKISQYLIDVYTDIQYSVFKICFNIHVWYLKYIEKHLFLKKPELIEPTTPEWIMISSLLYVDNTYKLVNTNIPKSKKIEEEYSAFYKSFYSNHIYSDDSHFHSSTKEHVFIAKTQDNKYICKVCFPGHIKCFSNDEVKEDDTKDIEEICVSFLYIEYTHPTKMQKPIPLPFPNGLFQPLNELFTPTFVLRQLQTQTEYYYFDMDYILTIIDEDLNTIVLKSNQYILLQKNTYDILER